MTGRAAGYCAGYSTPGYMNPYGGRGYGFGRGRGFGFGRGMAWRRGWGGAAPAYGWAPPAYGAYPPAYGDPYANPWGMGQVSPEEEAKVLKNQAELMEKELEGIRQRVQELEKEASKK